MALCIPILREVLFARCVAVVLFANAVLSARCVAGLGADGTAVREHARVVAPPAVASVFHYVEMLPRDAGRCERITQAPCDVRGERRAGGSQTEARSAPAVAVDPMVPGENMPPPVKVTPPGLEPGSPD